jgi:CubicO group peptidase (beta-lactamase class C family)
LSKAVATTSAALLLIEEGRLSPDDPVSRYIAGFSANGKEGVTIRALATHVSGLKAYEDFRVVDEAKEPHVAPPDALIRHYANLPVTHPPHGKVVYSCLNLQILARVNETILGRTQDEVLKERVFEPLGMSNTTYFLSPEQLTRTAPSQRGVAMGLIHDPLARYHGTATHCPGNAGLFSTGPDLAAFCLMLVNGGRWKDQQVFKTSTLAAAFAVQTATDSGDLRGFGWDVWDSEPFAPPGRPEGAPRPVGHTGYTGTLLWVDPHTGSWVVLLTNRTWPDDSQVSSSRIGTLRRGVVQRVASMLPVSAVESLRETDKVGR